MLRKEVYKRIDEERKYQQKKWGRQAVEEERVLFQSEEGLESIHEVETFILYMQDYLESARKLITRLPDKTIALDKLRKVVALGVACFEQHGCPERKT